MAPAAAKATKEEEAIQLSPCEVVSANDVGWLAGNTMLGNRTNQPLKDTPITIDALTQEFLMDVGAFTPEQAGAWVANVAVAPDNLRTDLGNFNFRGMTNQFSANRNFFRWYGPQDNYNIERLDFGRGSNTLIFGDNDPGGQATTYTKRALPYRRFTKILAQYGSWGSYRAEFDHNQPLGPTLAFRLNAVERIDYRNFDYNRFRFPGVHGAVSWQPTRHTGLRFEGEASGNYRTWGDNSLLIRERAFTGLGFTSRLTVLPNGRVVDNGTVAAYDLFRENVNTNISRTGIPSTPGTGPTGLTGVDLSISNALNWGLTPLSPEFKTIRTGSSPDVTSQRSRGVETTLTYFPATGLSVRVSGAYKEVRFVDAFPVLKALLAAAQARGPITDPTVQQTVALLQNAAYVQGAGGRSVSGQFPGSCSTAPTSGRRATRSSIPSASPTAPITTSKSTASPSRPASRPRWSIREWPDGRGRGRAHRRSSSVSAYRGSSRDPSSARYRVRDILPAEG